MSYRIERRHLNYFLAVAEELHFRKAADRLYISQPGLSRQIKQMENELGVVLFERTNKKVILTKAGKYLKDEVTVLLKHLDDSFDHTQLIHEGMEGQISLGYVGSAMQNVIPQLLLRIKEDHPNIHYSLREMENPDQIDALIKKEIDLAFVRLDKVPKGLDIRPVFEDTFSLVLPENHSVNKENFQGLKNFKEEDNTVHASTIFRLVENNLGISIVPSSLGMGYNMKVKLIELDKIPQKTVLSVAWNSSNRNPILEKILSKMDGT